jgi:rhamnulokinase
LRPGTTAIMGMQLDKPLVNELGRDLGFTNEIGYKGSACFHKRLPGLWVFEQCQRIWEKENRQFDLDLLTHMASAATPFESLINLNDPRFEQPEDMPLKIQAFCKETNQEVPRKPGQIFRCILESMALLYRKTLQQIEYLTGTHIERLYMLGGGANDLLNHFIANALQVQVMLVSPNAAAVGNIVVQALALGHLQSIEQGREMVNKALQTQTIFPHPIAWVDAFDRFEALTAETPEAPATPAT